MLFSKIEWSPNKFYAYISSLGSLISSIENLISS